MLLALLARLVREHGWRYVVLVVCVYGINQGAGEGLAFFAQQYWMTENLNLSPARYAEVSAITSIPWQIKSLYGIASDVLPLCGGLHRQPYMILSSLVGLVAFGMLWRSVWALTVAGSTALLFLANLSIATPDVMVDASIAQKSSQNPALAADLQTLCWAAFGVFKIASLVVVPYVMAEWGVRSVFALATVTSLAVTLPSLAGWMGEQRDPVRTEDTVSFATRVREFARDEQSGPIVTLSLLVTCISLLMGAVAMFSEEHAFISLFALVGVTPVLAALVYVYESRVDAKLAKFSLYVFLSGAIQPSSPVLFYWMKADEENCARGLPCFAPDFIASLSIVGYVVFVLATLAYNRYLTKVSYRRVYTCTQLGLFVLNMVDLVWVKRWNVTVLGLSDKAFVLGDEVISPVIARWNTMPMLILASQLCPDRVEATLFALTMGLSNFGGTLGGYFGVGLMEWFDLGLHKYDGMAEFVVARSMFRLLPLLLVPWLVPEGSPEGDSHKQEGRGTAEQEEEGEQLRPVDALVGVEVAAPGAGGSATYLATV